MDEVYTCICKSQSWTIHDGFIKCCYCSVEFKFKGQALQNVTDFNERVKQAKEDIADDSKTCGGG